MHSSNRWAYYPIALHAALTSYVAWLSGLRSDVLLLSKPPDLFSVPRCGFQPTLPITTTTRFSTSMAPGWLLSVRTSVGMIYFLAIFIPQSLFLFIPLATVMISCLAVWHKDKDNFFECSTGASSTHKDDSDWPKTVRLNTLQVVGDCAVHIGRQRIVTASPGEVEQKTFLI